MIFRMLFQRIRIQIIFVSFSHYSSLNVMGVGSNFVCFGSMGEQAHYPIRCSFKVWLLSAERFVYEFYGFVV